MKSSWDNYRAFAEKAAADGNLEESERMWLHALEEAERFGAKDSRLPLTIDHLADIALKQGKVELAEKLYLKALSLRQEALGEHHLDVGSSASNLAELYCSHGQFEEAEPLYLKVLEIYEKAFGPDHPGIAMIATNLAIMYHAQEKYDQAEPLYKRSIAIHTKLSGYKHADTLKVMDNYAELLLAMGRSEEAVSLREVADASADGVWRSTLTRMPRSTLSLNKIPDKKPED
jgi:tetratricopeptide (TPR) repeat protein